MTMTRSVLDLRMKRNGFVALALSLLALVSLLLQSFSRPGFPFASRQQRFSGRSTKWTLKNDTVQYLSCMIPSTHS